METNPKSHTDTIRAMFRDRDSGSVNHIVSHLTQSTQCSDIENCLQSGLTKNHSSCTRCFVQYVLCYTSQKHIGWRHRWLFVLIRPILCHQFNVMRQQILCSFRSLNKTHIIRKFDPNFIRPWRISVSSLEWFSSFLLKPLYLSIHRRRRRVHWNRRQTIT